MSHKDSNPNGLEVERNHDGALLLPCTSGMYTPVNSMDSVDLFKPGVPVLGRSQPWRIGPLVNLSMLDPIGIEHPSH